MYMAQMFCYGWDNTEVGITGIIGCIGVVFRGSRNLYAIHVPPRNQEVNALGGQAFATFVGTKEGARTNEGELLVFVNGRNRSSAEEEARAIMSQLKPTVTKVYRIMKNLGPGSGGFSADPVTIWVKNVIGGIKIMYKRVPDQGWTAGGKGKEGRYGPDPTFDSIDQVPTDLMSGWHDVDDKNCSVVRIR